MEMDKVTMEQLLQHVESNPDNLDANGKFDVNAALERVAKGYAARNFTQPEASRPSFYASNATGTPVIQMNGNGVPTQAQMGNGGMVPTRETRLPTDVMDAIVKQASTGNPGDLTRLVVDAQDAQYQSALQNSQQSGMVKQASAPNVTAPNSMADFYSQFKARTVVIDKIDDLPTRGTEVSNLAGDVAGYLAQARVGISKTAEGIYGVPELEKTLVEREAADRASPNYKYFLSDSPVTAKVRTDLEQARTFARQKAADLEKQSPEMAKLDIESRAFLATQDKITTGMMNKSTAQADRDLNMIAQVGIDAIQVGKDLNPGYTEAESAKFMLTARTDPVIRQLVDATASNSSEALVGVALANNSARADQLVANKQAVAVAAGNPALIEGAKARALSDIRDMRKMTTDPVRMQKLLARVYTPDDLEKTNSIRAERSLSLSPAQRLKEEQDFYRNAVLVDKSKTHLANIVTSVNNWDANTLAKVQSDPDMTALISAVGKEGIPPSLENLVGKVMLIPDNKVKAATISKLKDYVKQTVDVNNRGLYGQVDLMSATAAIDKATAKHVVSRLGAAGEYLGKSLDKSINVLLPVHTTSTLISGAYNYLTEPLGENDGTN